MMHSTNIMTRLDVVYVTGIDAASAGGYTFESDQCGQA